MEQASKRDRATQGRAKDEAGPVEESSGRERGDKPKRVREGDVADTVVRMAESMVQRLAVEQPDRAMPQDWRSDATQLTSPGASGLQQETEFGETIRLIGNGIVEGQLDEPELGALRVSVERSESGVKIMIRLDNAAVASVLEGQRTQLLQALQSRGIAVAGVQIVTGEARGIGLAARRSAPSDSSADASADGLEGGTETDGDTTTGQTADRLNVRA